MGRLRNQRDWNGAEPLRRAHEHPAMCEVAHHGVGGHAPLHGADALDAQDSLNRLPRPQRAASRPKLRHGRHGLGRRIHGVADADEAAVDSHEGQMHAIDAFERHDAPERHLQADPDRIELGNGDERRRRLHALPRSAVPLEDRSADGRPHEEGAGQLAIVAKLRHLGLGHAGEGQDLRPLLERGAGLRSLRPRHDQSPLGDDALLEKLLVATQLFRGEIGFRQRVQIGALSLDEFGGLQNRDWVARAHVLVRRDQKRLHQAGRGRGDDAQLLRRDGHDAWHDDLADARFGLDRLRLDAGGADLLVAQGQRDFADVRRRRRLRGEGREPPDGENRQPEQKFTPHARRDRQR